MASRDRTEGEVSGVYFLLIIGVVTSPTVQEGRWGSINISRPTYIARYNPDTATSLRVLLGVTRLPRPIDTSSIGVYGCHDNKDLPHQLFCNHPPECEKRTEYRELDTLNKEL